MSSSIDAAALLIEHNWWEINLQKIVEITTPIGWAHGFVNYRSMCDFQRLSRTTFLHFSVPLSRERQLNCWATWFVLQIGCHILTWDLCEFHTEQ
jgi:hypothetical protein